MAHKMDRVCNMTMMGTMLSVRGRCGPPAVAANRERRAGQWRGLPVQPGEGDQLRSLLHAVLRKKCTEHSLPEPGQLVEPQVVRRGVLQTRAPRPLDSPIVRAATLMAAPAVIVPRTPSRPSCRARRSFRRSPRPRTTRNRPPSGSRASAATRATACRCRARAAQ